MYKIKQFFIWWRKYKCDMNWHDYLDSDGVMTPHHFYTYTCRHCKNKFEI